MKKEEPSTIRKLTASGLHYAVLRDSSAEGVVARMPRTIGRSIRTSNNNDIAIRVPHPALPVIWPAVAIEGVSVTRHDDLDIHFGGPLHSRFKIINLEPQQHPVTIGLIIPISDWYVVVLTFEAVQLQNELPICDELLINGASVIA